MTEESKGHIIIKGKSSEIDTQRAITAVRRHWPEAVTRAHEGVSTTVYKTASDAEKADNLPDEWESFDVLSEVDFVVLNRGNDTFEIATRAGFIQDIVDEVKKGRSS